MKYIKSFVLFWYHFIVGDDWRVAVGVIVGFGINACLVHVWHVQLWWLMPIAIVVMLAISLRLAVRNNNRS